MLQRLLETEVMDTVEEARDYDSMDHSEVNRAFVQDFLAVWSGGGPILDVGTGTAQIPIELCRRNASVTVVGIDLAEHMLSVARDNVVRAGLAGRIQLQRTDAKGLPYDEGHFGAVISNSIVHHIPQPQAALTEMVRVVKAGGTIFVRDLLRPETETELRELVRIHAGDANPHQQQMFADSLHAALTLEEIRTLVQALQFDPSGVRQTTDRHWTWASRKT
jgi:ubiquinone/menaquinone biosynthesis C-methylase UbiE